MDFSSYPDHAFAFVNKKARSEGRDDYRRFLHHTSNVRKGNENKSVDLALLHTALEEMSTAILPPKFARRAFNHLKNHAKTVIANERKHDVSPEREELHSEIFFLIDEITDNGFEEEKFVKMPETPVFRAGTWNDSEYTSDDLYEIVGNFNRLRNSFLPAIKEGHTHGWMAGMGCPKEDEERLGSIVDMRTDGQFIYATFEVDPYVYYWKFENRSLRYKSCEICSAWDYNGENIGKVMTAVAALGVSPPAVGDLGEINLQEFSTKTENAEIIAIDFEERKEDMKGKKKEFEAELAVEEVAPAVEPEAAEEEAAQDEVLDEQAAEEEVEEVAEEAAPEAEAEVVEEPAEPAPVEEVQPEPVENFSANESNALFQRIQELEAKLEAADKNFEKLFAENLRKDIEHRVENLIKDGHVAPVDRDIVQQLFEALQGGRTTLTFSKDDGSTEEIRAVELFEKFLETRKAWPTEELGQVPQSDTEDLALREALPQKAEGVPVGRYGRDVVEKKNVELAARAAKLQEEFAAKGVQKSFVDCMILAKQA